MLQASIIVFRCNCTGHLVKDCRVGNTFIAQPNRSGFHYSSSATPTKDSMTGHLNISGNDAPFDEFIEVINDCQHKRFTGSALL